MNHNEFDLDRFMREMIAPRAGRIIALLAVIVLVIWGVATCFYSVPADSEAVVKRFGAVTRIQTPGLHFKLPFGIETAINVPTKRVLKEEFGFRTVEAGRQSRFTNDPRLKERESLMLTGDLNVIDVEWVVQYQITDPDKWLHTARERRDTIRDVSEAVMRRIIGNHLGSEALTVARAEIADIVKQEMQYILDDPREDSPYTDYDMGIHIGAVEMQDVTPPDPVKPAFNDVNKSRQERQSLINQAERTRNQLIPKARGEAEQTIAEAEAYKAERVNAAKGEAARFTAILREYQNAPDVTRRRLYLEMIDKLMPRIGKLYVVEHGQQAPLPLLDLNAAGAAGKRGGGGAKGGR